MGNFAGVLFLFLFFIAQYCYCYASCYFSQEFQGSYLMQNSGALGFQYTPVNVNENMISVLGRCHRRISNNYIMAINETNCLRCIHMKLRSFNVLHIIAKDPAAMTSCSTEEKALAQCPTDHQIESGNITEIILYKIKDITGTPIPKQNCPIDGKYFLNYKSPQGSCHGYTSTLDTCPSTSILNLKLRNCTFDNKEVKFNCLAHWKGTNNETFLLFSDNRHNLRSATNHLPQYRCGLYKQFENGDISLALSSDSTCLTGLYNSTFGFESFNLTPIPEKAWPLEIAYEVCSFPQWMHGDWEQVTVTENTMIYRDHERTTTYTIKCVAEIDVGDKFVAFIRSQCDDEFFGCIKIANRSNNIMEFQIGSDRSDYKKVFPLCAENKFEEGNWISQGRVDIVAHQSAGLCPITGEFAGTIPDATDLCAKLWSDCRAPGLMYYEVFGCESGEVYEEREYQCLGHWREGNLVYTYTQRNNVAPGTYECFVGSIFSEDNFYIREAGTSCQRNINPTTAGMKLVKTQPSFSCDSKNFSNHEAQFTTRKIVTTTVRHFTAPSPTSSPKKTTAVQEFDSNAIPEHNEHPNSAATFSSTLPSILGLYICFKCFLF